jgi:hypothetical protein
MALLGLAGVAGSVLLQAWTMDREGPVDIEAEGEAA